MINICCKAEVQLNSCNPFTVVALHSIKHLSPRLWICQVLSSFPAAAHQLMTETSKVQGECTGLPMTSYQPCQAVSRGRSLNSPDKSAVHCVEQGFQNTSVSSTERTIGLELFVTLHLEEQWQLLCTALRAQVQQISKYQESRYYSEASLET